MLESVVMLNLLLSFSQAYWLINSEYFRPYWRCYFPNTQAIIYVVDSSDTERLVIAKEEFHAILEVSFLFPMTGFAPSSDLIKSALLM